MSEKKRICYVATIEMTVKAFLLEYIRALSRSCDITVIANTEDPDFLKSFGVDVEVIPLKIERKISLLKDLQALFSLFSIFRSRRFAIVHSIMPKSGLLSMVAGFGAGIPNRLHTFTGQVWATRTGLKRSLLKCIDRVLVFFSTAILVDSNSQREFLMSEKIVAPDKSLVLAKGSITGVDTQRFRPDADRRGELRRDLGISKDDIVFLFLGRLTKDKGLLDLAQAFAGLCAKKYNLRLVVVGPDEEGMRERMLNIAAAYSTKIIFKDYTDRPQNYMAAADVFCLPSYREGFGNVIIEAAASGSPAIGTRIYGITDAIEDGITGFLYEPRDINSLSDKMLLFAENTALRQKMGEEARKRAVEDFSKEKVVSALLEFYEKLPGKSRLPVEG
ncbi:MAG: glycosyltransferase family 1 protein [Nitrospirae bacterium]|nr:MAG: glycosyltransferase family 1 protein [Nitrospirota bacterium]